MYLIFPDLLLLGVSVLSVEEGGGGGVARNICGEVNISCGGMYIWVPSTLYSGGAMNICCEVNFGDGMYIWVLSTLYTLESRLVGE